MNELQLAERLEDWQPQPAPRLAFPILTIRYQALDDDQARTGLPTVVITRARDTWPACVEFEVAFGRPSAADLERLFRDIEHEVLEFSCDAPPSRGRYLVRHPDPDAPQTPLATGMRISFDAIARTITIERPQ